MPTPPEIPPEIISAYRRDEREAVQALLQHFHHAMQIDTSTQASIQTLARKLVETLREKRTGASGVNALMHEFSLSSDEGIALMCLAEALLRIPDRQTADRLIADKISKGDWGKHLGESPSLFVNAAAWGLLITGKLVSTSSEQGLGSALTKLLAKGGEPLIRKGVDLAMRMLGNQFVTGRTIDEALANSRGNEARGYRYSYDMLGEAAMTAEDAAKYYAAYEQAIHAIGRAANGRGVRQGPGISVKLSALHPRYSRAQRERVMQELLPNLKKLLLLAKQYNIGFNIDAEEADRLALSLDLMNALVSDPNLEGFDGIGFVVQAYQKRCPFVIDYLIELARKHRRKWMVRLVKGAYWDTEIKRAQTDGLSGYPVYTRKVYTDVCYLVCAQKLLAATDAIYPQFATHNAHTLAAIHTLAQSKQIDDYEFQCLHGMGEALYDQVIGKDKLGKPCRIYAPVGSHETLLAYLVRRLLENGANSSFVNQIVDEDISVESLIADPFEAAKKLGGEPHPDIPLPVHLFGNERKNSRGLDLSDENTLQTIDAAFAQFTSQSVSPSASQQWQARPLLHGEVSACETKPVVNPANHRDVAGYVIEANADDAGTALAAAKEFAIDWQTLPPFERATILMRAADLLEHRQLEFMFLAIREAGKSLPNAVAEVREAIDFLRYYAAEIRTMSNPLAWGPVVCISPWNFPLAIFIGQISAALAAGNVVLAKPAEQTPLIAYRATQLLHEAGVPRSALQFLPGPGETIGAKLTADRRVRGVIFTGSTEVAQSINRVLAKRAAEEMCDIPFIAETGGQNALIVDSSALPEQVVQDVLTSAFDSAGQRCSALRILCLQNDIADKILHMLRGAMQELCVGNPNRLATDIGPVIDAEAQHRLNVHINAHINTYINTHPHRFYQLPLPAEQKYGTFVAPALLEIGSIAELQREVFGPVLHVIRYQRDTLPQLVDAINATGYGLTLGIHSRIDETIDFIASRAHVGNMYVNRNIVGAVVGVQPFGGDNKSGTGPKAGGPLYLKRLQRNPSARLGPHTIHANHAKSKDVIDIANISILHALLAWVKNHGYEHAATLGEQYAHETLLNTMLMLPGPTGERNTLSFVPRGTVLCIANNMPVLLNQIAAALATGNKVCIATDCLNKFPTDFPPEIRTVIHSIDYADIAKANLQLALAGVHQSAALRLLLAEREGALTPVMETTAETAIPLWRLVTERTLCVNTAAAGGNASLMSLNA